MVNLKKATDAPQASGNRIDKAQVRTDLPISYLQAGDNALPVLIEDMREMAPKVIVSEGMLKILVGTLRPANLIDIKRGLQNKISKAEDMTELIEVLAHEVQFHTSLELIKAYFDKAQ